MAYQQTDYTRQQRAEALTALLKAGHRILSKSGFAGIVIAEIAAAAGMASGNVYRYFKNKDALVVALFERATEHEIHAVFDSVNPRAPAPIQMEMLLTAFAQRAQVNPTLAYALLAEPVAAALEKARQRYRGTWAEKFATVIGQGIEEQSFIPQPARIAAVAIVAAMADSLARAPSEPAIKPDQLNALIDFCLRGLGVSPTGDRP